MVTRALAVPDAGADDVEITAAAIEDGVGSPTNAAISAISYSSTAVSASHDVGMPVEPPTAGDVGPAAW